MSIQNSPEAGLTRTSVSSFHWSALNTVTTSGAQFITSILLARILEPKDFGVMAFAMVFVTLTSRITEFGIAPAIVQTRVLNRDHLRVGSTVMVILALACYAGLYIAAPWVASGLRLRVLRAAALSLVISAFGLVSNSTLQRDLRFKEMFYIGFFSSVGGYGLVSITLALLGYGPWSLVLGYLSQLLLRNLAYCVVSPHSMLPSIKWKEATELLNYGLGMSLGTLANVVAKNGHLFIVGNILGDAVLGIYQRAYSLISFPIVSWNSAATSVLFPVLARVQDQQDRMGRGFLTSVSLTSFVLFPIMVMIALCAPEIVIGLLTEKWMAAIPVMRLFCILGVFAAIYPLGDALGRASGRVYIKSMIHIVYAVTSIVLCYAAARHGILFVAGAMVISVIITYVLMGILATRILSVSYRSFLEAQMAGVYSSLAVLCVCCPVSYLGRWLGIPSLALLAMQVLASAVGFAGVLFYLPKPYLDSPRRIARDYLARVTPRGLRRNFFERSNS